MSSTISSTKTKSKKLIAGMPIALGISALFFFLKGESTTIPAELSSLNIPGPNNFLGYRSDEFDIKEDTIRFGQVFTSILEDYGVAYSTALDAAIKSKETFDVTREMRANKPFKVLQDKKSGEAEAFIYETNKIESVVFHLRDSIYAEKMMKPVDTILVSASGIIESSLWNAITQNGIGDNETANLAARMEDAFAWTVDFHHLLNGDHFKLVYEELRVDGEVVGLGNLEAAVFNASGNDFYAINYVRGPYDGYYDLEGKAMKRGFLKAPVKYSRISSRYSPKRFHPVLKRYKAHLGTDFAAPKGTPIIATANGVIIRRGYTKGNGNYVKIKHDDTYSTQYLHMSAFAKGQAVGSHVKQGQVIGYVGSTGYATGPHVCYRFWKNGKQVDALRVVTPAPEPMPDSELPAYKKVKDIQKSRLDKIELPAQKVIASSESSEATEGA